MAVVLRLGSDAGLCSTGEEAQPPLQDAPPQASPELGELEGFQPARRSAARTRSGQMAGRAPGVEQGAPANLLQGLEGSMKTAQTPDEWLSLWRLWVLQV